MAKKKIKIVGVQVLSNHGRRDFVAEDKIKQKGVEIKNFTNSGHMNIDPSEIYSSEIGKG